MISNAIRPIQIGQVLSEQQLAAEADVVVLRIVVAFFTIGLRIETEVFRYLPVTIDAVIEARAINVAGMHAGLGAIDTRIGNRLIAAEEFMLDAAQQGDLEVTAIQIVTRSIVELLAENEKRKKKMHPIERIARFHLEFEGIHPFIDGNGRTGRLLLNLDLIQNGYPAINVKFADRKTYYTAFDEFYKNSDAEPMIKLVANYVINRIEQYLEILK